MRPVLFILAVLLQQSSGVIYYLNETEFDRMPVKYQLDNYNKCLKQPDGLYCTVNFNLVSDVSNELLQMIQEYSEVVTTHYNYTKLRYGICLSENCKSYANKTADPELILEGCLNDSLWKDYELKTRVTYHSCYSLSDQTNGLDAGDILVAVVIVSILLLNIIGSIYENYLFKRLKGNSILLCFSLSRNWKQLTSEELTDPRLQRLRGLNGLKCIILGGVTLAHCIWPFLLLVENLHDLEMLYTDLSKYIILNGPLMIQTYLVVSGFLLVYKMQIYSEKHNLTWWLVPKGILTRYLRITPAWAVLIALSATWFKFAGPGPFWDVSGGPDIADCRSRWWVSLLYLNNYIYESRCMMHTWYLAVDMQLYCLGLIICVLLKTPKHRGKVLSSVFTLGLIVVAAHIYLQDLSANLILSPESTAALFVTDPTFNEVYKRGHTNIPSYVIGMALGYLVYKWQEDVDIEKYKKYRILYWLIFPLVILILLSGRIFYRDAPRDPIYLRILYGTFSKPLIGFLAAVLIAGMVLKLEGIYRLTLEWRAWTIPGRLSFCAFMLHFSFLSLYISVQTNLKTLGPYDIKQEEIEIYMKLPMLTSAWGRVRALITCACVILERPQIQYYLFVWMTMISYIISIPLWLLVEAPFVEITKFLFLSQGKEKQGKDNEAYSAKL